LYRKKIKWRSKKGKLQVKREMEQIDLENFKVFFERPTLAQPILLNAKHE